MEVKVSNGTFEYRREDTSLVDKRDIILTKTMFGRKFKNVAPKWTIRCPKCKTTFMENLYHRHKKICQKKCK